MLILGRGPGDQIVIPTPIGPIRITVIDMRGHRVHLGFEAPDPVRVWRQELLDDTIPETVATVWGPMQIGG